MRPERWSEGGHGEPGSRADKSFMLYITRRQFLRAGDLMMFFREQKAHVSGTKHSLMHAKYHRSIFNQLKLLVSDQDIFGALRRPVGICLDL